MFYHVFLCSNMPRVFSYDLIHQKVAERRLRLQTFICSRTSQCSVTQGGTVEQRDPLSNLLPVPVADTKLQLSELLCLGKGKRCRHVLFQCLYQCLNSCVTTGPARSPTSHADGCRARSDF